jgi:hypothetical protein
MPLATIAEPPPGLATASSLPARRGHGRRRLAPAPRTAPTVSRPAPGRLEPLRRGRPAAALALAFGLDAARTRRELSLERELASALHEPNVLKTFTLASTGGGGGGYGTVALDLDAKARRPSC